MFESKDVKRTIFRGGKSLLENLSLYPFPETNCVEQARARILTSDRLKKLKKEDKNASKSDDMTIPPKST